MSVDVSGDAPGPAGTRAGFVAVSPGYFDTLNIRMHDGRAFTAADRLDASPVAIVSNTLARRLWPGGRAVGARLTVAVPQAGGAVSPPAVYTVVGVAGDVRHVTPTRISRTSTSRSLSSRRVPRSPTCVSPGRSLRSNAT